MENLLLIFVLVNQVGLVRENDRGAAPIASPGGKLSGNRLFGTDFLTEEECGQQSEMQYNASDLCVGWTQDATQEYVFTFPIIVSCRPHSSPDPFGATLPPGEGIGCVSDRYLCNLTWFFKQVHVF